MTQKKLIYTKVVSTLLLSLFLLTTVALFPLEVKASPDVFGETEDGPTGAPIYNAYDATYFICPKDGVGQNMSALIYVASAGDKVKMALYKKSDNSLVASTEEFVATTDGKYWITKAF